MRRSKQNITYWRQTRDRLYKAHPESQLVKNRYRTLKALMKEKYPEIVVDDGAIEFMRDVIYNDRQIRQDTEGREKELKKILEQEAILELDK